MVIGPEVPTEATRLPLWDRLSLRSTSQYVTMIELNINAIFLTIVTIKGVQQVPAAERRGATVPDLSSDAIFHDIVVSISAIVGLYVVASIIHVGDLSLEDYE